MRIVARYSFNDGETFIKENYPELLREVEEVVAGVEAHQHKTKTSKEKTMSGRMLYSPPALNKAFKEEFGKKKGWRPVKVYCDYSKEYYVEGYQPKQFRGQRPYREMDFVKDKLGVEVQFGKYAFMVYNVCAKMTIFRNLEYITCGIEIVPVRGLTREMSTGVAYFEQFTWDLKKRGVGDIDIPVLILGIDADVLVAEGETAEVLG
ncbi:MAG TPA: BglII/BstYI family type II restriction endonuclease [Pyrinomonadaceae bacterium]|nr:BglII/BstYI family type II restriction endonuclease [Pyrinomonadaceae bacterium]